MAENENTSYREYSWLSLVLTLDKKHHIPDEDVYEISNGRKFKNTDHTDSGVYDGS